MPYWTNNPLPEEEDGIHKYFLNNNAFTYIDGMVLQAMIATFRPKKYIEIGSGYSSACALDTFQALNYTPTTIFIEPYPNVLYHLYNGCPPNSQCIIEEIQKVDLSIFSQLDKNDFLFIDSTHVAKTGSDVLHELFNILPLLKPGVIVHFHDIFWPFEYPESWVFEENRSWNEIYLLRSFLMNNKEWKILFFNDLFQKYAEVENIPLPGIFNKYPRCGGSIWLKKINKGWLWAT